MSLQLYFELLVRNEYINLSVTENLNNKYTITKIRYSYSQIMTEPVFLS